MKIATFNINGVRARIETLTRWLAEAQPDVVALQEIKCQDGDFPAGPIADLGYNIETLGQKGFNGVAILSRRPVEDVLRGLPGDPEDPEARYLEATIGARRPVRLGALYLPNGNPWPGPRFDYKLRWMERLRARGRDLLRSEMPCILLGDFNVIPEPRDAANPEKWRDDALFRPESRAGLRRILHEGWADAIRLRDPDSPRGPFTFWDYKGNAFARDDGIRIDHVLLSPQAADRLIDAGVDRDERARDKPSDHVPVWVDLED